MQTVRTRTVVSILTVLGLVAVAARRRATSRPGPDLWTAEPVLAHAGAAAAIGGARRGAAGDRGGGGGVQMDLDRARAEHVDPVVEFLTFIQQKRGDESHLLFVRTDDLDAMARAANEPLDRFLARLDQLGVVVSPN